ncbi:hypothetical protein N825_00380 [Skermanella stibiiresistens SB22]|uniref:Uncharacterized protein n=1 Tax=Skermanella stibiiresistens SB22 TaxID=1385369 RepID=W9H9Z9_9PROT|nr:hypothetical protein [Skermanella stibiiresistens]EWY42784.1 hypothetical protein N825_00380 [Skermanella stibiiresistens SB22]
MACVARVTVTLEAVMSDYKRKLEEMKRILATDDDFGRVYRIFFDDVVTDRAFMALGEKNQSPLLRATLRIIGEDLLGTSCRVTGLRLIKLGRDKFVHGCCDINGHPTTLIYFEDIDMGMTAMIRDMATMVVTYSRVSTLVIKDPGRGAIPVPGTAARH